MENDNFKKKKALGKHAENVARVEAELKGLTCEMVGEVPRYYYLGDIVVVNTNQIVEVKRDCQIIEKGNILFEWEFKKPVDGTPITYENKNVLQYEIEKGWLQKGHYEWLMYIDMVAHERFVINYPKAKKFLCDNLKNHKIVKKVKALWNKDENKLGTYYLIPYKILIKNRIAQKIPITQMFKSWLETDYDASDDRTNWIMDNISFIPMPESFYEKMKQVEKIDLVYKEGGDLNEIKNFRCNKY